MNLTRKPRRESRKEYCHLLHREREEIAILLSQFKTIREIGLILGRSPSTISREIKRNGTPTYKTQYRAHQAELQYQSRLKESHSREHICNPKLRKLVIKMIKLGLSPLIIEGRIKKKYKDLNVSHETIYQFIYNQQTELRKHLPFAHRTRRKRGLAKGKRLGKVQNRVMIGERPKIVDARSRLGDWEGDTAVSRESSSVLVVNIERKSRMVKISKTESRQADLVSEAMTKNMRSIKLLKPKTLTLDNGTENARHEEIAEKNKIKIYFTNPFHSWEKGSIEQVIGLIRRYLPKKTDFKKVTTKTLSKIESLLNNRPRKCLGFLTPLEFVALHT